MPLFTTAVESLKRIRFPHTARICAKQPFGTVNVNRLCAVSLPLPLSSLFTINRKLINESSEIFEAFCSHWHYIGWSLIVFDVSVPALTHQHFSYIVQYVRAHLDSMAKPHWKSGFESNAFAICLYECLYVYYTRMIQQKLVQLAIISNVIFFSQSITKWECLKI